MNFKHYLWLRKCIDSMDVDEKGDVYCAECGRKIGFVYCVDPLKVFIYQRYVRHRSEITGKLLRLMRCSDIFSKIDHNFLESNDATIKNTIDYLVDAFDENMICVDDDAEENEEDYFDEEEDEEDCE